MAVPETITIGANNYSAYIDQADADAFLAADASRYVAWAALSDDQKKINIVTASRRLDRLNWKGTLTDPTTPQPLAWPRDSVGVSGLDDGETPQAVLDACAFLAGDLALDSSEADKLNQGKNIKAVGAGSARVEFFKPTDGPKLKGPILELLRQYLEGGVLSTAGNHATNITGLSSFDDCDRFDRSSGYP